MCAQCSYFQETHSAHQILGSHGQVHSRNTKGSVVNASFLSWSWLQPSLVPHFPSCHSLPITQSFSVLLNNPSCHLTYLLHTILSFLFWYHENSLGQEVLLISPLDPWYLITCLGKLEKLPVTSLSNLFPKIKLRGSYHYKILTPALPCLKFFVVPMTTNMAIIECSSLSFHSRHHSLTPLPHLHAHLLSYTLWYACISSTYP